VKHHEYHFQKVIFGNSLAALLMGYKEGTPVITLGAREPLFFEHYPIKTDLSFLGIDNRRQALQSTSSTLNVGVQKRDVYRRVSFLMSLAGLLPFAGSGVSLRQTEANKARMVLDHARSVSFSYDKSIIVGTNLLEPEIPPKKYMVLDWMDVRSGMVHPFDRIEGTSPFVNCIHFYPSERIDGKHDKKDLVCVSYLTKDQLYNYEYSDTYARFSILEQMRKAGIRGARNGRDTKNPERYKYYAVKIETNKREVFPVEPDVDYLPKPTEHKYLKHLTETL
jgi:hypothetical protein